MALLTARSFFTLQAETCDGMQGMRLTCKMNIGQRVAVLHVACLTPAFVCVCCRYDGPAEDLSLDFTVEDETFGGRVVQDLLDNGSEITVTSSNKMQYVLLVADCHLNGRLGAAAGSFASGLAQVSTHTKMPCKRVHTF